jgi:hypothetical protein
MKQYEDITHLDIINILNKLKKNNKVDSKFVDIIVRRFEKHNLTVLKAVKIIHRVKGIDIRYEILAIRIKNNDFTTRQLEHRKSWIKNNILNKNK